MAAHSCTLLLLILLCGLVFVTGQNSGDSALLLSAISQFNVIKGYSVTSSFSSIGVFLNVDVYTCAAKCMWSPSCGGFNYFVDSISGLTSCELRLAISGPKFLSSVSRNASSLFYYKKCPSSFVNYSAQYKTYYYVYSPYATSGLTANSFCANAGLQLLQNRNSGELQYIWRNVLQGQGHIWLNANLWSGTAYWANDGDAVDFSISSPGGSRCGYALGRECINTSNYFNSQWCTDGCTYTYPSTVCTCYDYIKLMS